jgi:hypothetical protein
MCRRATLAPCAVLLQIFRDRVQHLHFLPFLFSDRFVSKKLLDIAPAALCAERGATRRVHPQRIHEFSFGAVATRAATLNQQSAAAVSTHSAATSRRSSNTTRGSSTCMPPSGSMSGQKQWSEGPSFNPSRFGPVLAVLGLLVFSYVILLFLTELHEEGAEGLLSKLMWRNATVRPPFLLVLIIGGWGVVVRVCRSNGLNLDAVLGGRLHATSASYHAALVFLCIVLAFHLLHLVASEFPGITWRPWLTCNILLHLAIGGLGCTPARVFHADSRFSLLQTLWESVIAPFAPVTFWHVIVADYLTSLAKAFSDLQLSACISVAIMSERTPAKGSYTPTTVLWEAHYAECADTYWNALMLALPFWWRLMQCLKVYSGNGEQKNLWNALKYSTAFPLVYAGYLRRHAPSRAHDRYFMLAACVQSSYCFFWDVQMDWGLLRRDPRSPFGWSMREQLVSVDA